MHDMKIFITHIKSRNFILITEVVILAPFTYVSNEDARLETREDFVVDRELLDKNDCVAGLIFSSDSSTKKKEPLVVAKFIPTEKVKRGIVQNIDENSNSFILKVGETLLPIEKTATTTFYFGKGDEASSRDITNDMKVYVFGYIKSDNSGMSASKIIISNRAKILSK